MNISFIQHSSSASAGLIAEYFAKHTLGEVRKFYSNRMTELSEQVFQSDLVVVLGSARGVYDTHIPWVVEQRQLMKKLLDRSVPVFGICFGSQLLATAVGGIVRPSGNFHLGWYKNEDAVDPIWRGPWLRWHGDYITLPPSVEVLASADGVIQAFRHGSAVGVQFHPEATSDIMREWVADAALTSDRDASATAAIEYFDKNLTAIRERSYALFDHVLSLLDPMINKTHSL
jgi:GMP synthase-like glutamine amidotransferase